VTLISDGKRTCSKPRNAAASKGSDDDNHRLDSNLALLRDRGCACKAATGNGDCRLVRRQERETVPASAGTFPTTGGLFTGLVVGVFVIIGVTFLSALSLGPIVESLAMVAKTF
jgi:hypothetical protein